jgi:hypothetical protein
VTAECDKCRREREERERKRGAYWLTPDGRAEIRETWDTDPTAIPPSLLDAVEALEAEVKEHRARAAREPDLAPWYEADGSTVMLPAAEVERRRKLAALVIGIARKVDAALQGVRLPYENDGWKRLIDLRIALRALDAPAPSPSGTVHVDDGSGFRFTGREGESK